MQWRRMDLHLHTPSSSDYRDPDASYLKILLKAEERGLDIIAFTDHNSVSGYTQMLKEIETLELLERLGRLTDEEKVTLGEYRRLRETLLVLPGFEFTATFGFHILGIFPPGTSMRKLELLLLKLEVPEDKMLAGAPNAGATSDVTEAYEAIHEAGGLAIAAHVNSSNGVAMQGFNFGGQTKIAYTQHADLAALEVTDLDQTGRRTTASFFNGSKPEYPRRMHCIQGSDAHSIEREQSDGANKRLGVGDRCTEILVPEPSFDALRQLLASSDFDRSRPYRPVVEEAYDYVREAREAGSSIVQAFHERAISKTSKTRPILRDIAAFANTNGGTVFVGVGPEIALPVRGVEHPEETIQMLKTDVQQSVTPALDIDYTLQTSEGRPVLMIQVPSGGDKPYVFDPTGQIFVRVGSESIVANRDDIVRLVLESHQQLGGAELAAEVEALERADEETEEILEEAAGQTTPDASARRRRRRRRSPGDRASDVVADLIAAESEPEEEEEDVPPSVPSWDTTPAFEGPEDDYVFDQHGHAHIVDEDLLEVALTSGQDVARADEPIAELLAPVEMTEEPVEQLEEAVVEAPASSRRNRNRRRGSKATVAEEPAIDPAAELPIELPVASVAEQAPEEAVAEAPAIAEAVAEETPDVAVPATDPDVLRRKGLIYQVYKTEVGASKLGNAQQERRAGLYADKAGELLTQEVRAANPDGMFELDRNQVWLPEGVEPQMPEGLTASVRNPASLTAYRLTSRSGPGGHWRTLAELLPVPETTTETDAVLPVDGAEAEVYQVAQPDLLITSDLQTPDSGITETDITAEAAQPAADSGVIEEAPQPESEPAPAAKRNTRRRKPTKTTPVAEESSPTAEAAPTEVVAAETQPVEPEPTPETVAEPVETAPVAAPTAPAGRVLQQEKLSGRKVRQPAPAPEPVAEAPVAVAEAAPTPTIVAPPRTGVEVIETELRNGVPYHTMRDLRNHSKVHNVTRFSARRLWYYAITRHEAGLPNPDEVTWVGNVGLWRKVYRAGTTRYDLVSRDSEGGLHVYYGVTEEGIDGPWRVLDLNASEAVQEEEGPEWS